MVGDATLLFPNFSAPLCPNVSEPGNGAMSRSAHFEQNKGTLLYFGLRSESVVSICANYSSIRRYYRAYASRLCMLAYHFYTLSKPVTPLFNAQCSIHNAQWVAVSDCNKYNVKGGQNVLAAFDFMLSFVLLPKCREDRLSC